MQHLQKTGGGVPIMVNQVLETSHLPSSPAPCLCVSVAAPSSILRTHFQVPYPATPLFATLTKTAGVCTNNSQFGSYPSRLETQKERIGRGKPRPTHIEDGAVNARLRFDRVGGGVPGDGGLAEIGFVGHVAGQRGVVAEDSVLCNLLVVAYALEKSPQVRFFIVPGIAAKGEALLERLFAWLGIVLFVPFLEIGFAHRLRIAVSVIAGRFVFAGLRKVGNGEFRDFEDALGALEAVDFLCLTAKIQAEIHRSAAIVEERRVNVGHITAVLEAKDIAEGHGALGRVVPAEHEVHAADEMDEQIASETGAVFLPAPPAREVLGRHVRIPRPLGGFALPGVPIEIGEGEIGRRRIYPRAGGIVAAERAFNESESADDAVGEKFFGFGANDGADALRTNLHHAAGFFRGGDHGDAVGGGMRHGFFAIDIFAGADGVDDHLLVPMVRNGGDETVDFLVVEEIFVAARGGDFLADNLLGESVAAVVKIAGSDALDARKRNGVAKQAGALHADADDAEAQAIARRRRLQRQRNVFRFKKNRGRSRECAGGSSGAMEELTA